MNPQSFFIDSTDGKLKVFTTPIPKMPVRPESGSKHTLPDGSKKTLELGGDFGYEKALAKYHAAIELAKKKAVPMDFNDVKTRNLFYYTSLGSVMGDINEWVKDKIYTINMEEEIRIVYDDNRYPVLKRVARIIPKKAEEPEVKYDIHHNFNTPIGDSEWAASNGNQKIEEVSESKKESTATTWIIINDGNNRVIYKDGKLLEPKGGLPLGVMADGTIIDTPKAEESESQESMLDEILSNYRDFKNNYSEELSQSYETFIQSELENFEIKRKA